MLCQWCRVATEERLYKKIVFDMMAYLDFEWRRMGLYRLDKYCETYRRWVDAS